MCWSNFPFLFLLQLCHYLRKIWFAEHFLCHDFLTFWAAGENQVVHVMKLKSKWSHESFVWKSKSSCKCFMTLSSLKSSNLSLESECKSRDSSPHLCTICYSSHLLHLMFLSQHLITVCSQICLLCQQLVSHRATTGVGPSCFASKMIVSKITGNWGEGKNR